MAILQLLISRKACVCGDLVDELELAQATVSQHLKVLKAAGWIQGEVDGPRVCYCLDPKTLEKFESLIVTARSSGTKLQAKINRPRLPPLSFDA